MKKIILALVIVSMIAKPCFAQEVKTESIFSVEGTLWRVCKVTLWVYPFFGMNCDVEIGFHQGEVYKNVSRYFGDIVYINLGVVSIAYDIEPGFYYLAIMQPTIGLGVFWGIDYGYMCGAPGCVPYFWYENGIMFKINENWTPPGVFE